MRAGGLSHYCTSHSIFVQNQYNNPLFLGYWQDAHQALVHTEGKIPSAHKLQLQ